jgi:hypothetical protein
MLSGYKNPYAAGYTNQLTMPETPDLTNIKKSFENNPTSKDLLKLANTAGQPYDPNAQTSLSPALSKIYQPSITNSAGKATKPGAPDTTNTTLPVVPKAGEPIVTDTSAGQVVNPPVVNPPVVNPPVVNPPVVNPPVVNPPVVNPPVVNPPVVNPPVKTAAELAAEKAEAERQAGIKTLAEKAEATRLAAEKANTIFQQGNITAMPTGTAATGSNVFEKLPSNVIPNQYVSLPDNTVVQSVNPTTSNQTVSLTPTGPQPVYAATSSPTPAQNAGIVGTIDPSTLSVSNMNSNAGGLPSLAPINPNTYGPQQVTLNPNTVVSSPSGINALSAQTVALPPSGPQPINPSNGGPSSATVGPITAAQRDLGPLNISNLGAVIGPQAMNSNAGGLPSLMGPVAPAVQASAVPSTVSSLPKYNAPAQTVINAGTTRVLDSSGTPIPGRRRMTMSQ